jgi:hypothetical protein
MFLWGAISFLSDTLDVFFKISDIPKGNFILFICSPIFKTASSLKNLFENQLILISIENDKKLRKKE